MFPLESAPYNTKSLKNDLTAAIPTSRSDCRSFRCQHLHAEKLQDIETTPTTGLASLMTNERRNRGLENTYSERNWGK